MRLENEFGGHFFRMDYNTAELSFMRDALLRAASDLHWSEAERAEALRLAGRITQEVEPQR